MHRYFALVSGDSIELARAETEALVRLVASDSQVQWQERLAVIEAEQSPVDVLTSRAALLREAGDLFFSGSADEEVLDEMVPEFVHSTDTFRVNTVSLKNEANAQARAALTADIGNRIRRATGASVSLDSPRVVFTVIMREDGILVCTSESSKTRVALRQRKAGKKPFFHPSIMNASLARVLCNLVQLVPGETVVDPFCGAGGIICEAALLGAKTVGIELNWKLLRGAKVNLAALDLRETGLVLGDSTYIPVSGADCIVTDPPYGRVSSTRGAQSVQLVRRMLEQLDCVLSRNGRLCFCGSEEMKLGELASEVGYEVELCVGVRVHSSLVREVVVVRL